MFLAETSRGSVLLLAILVLGLMVFLATYFISFSLTGVQMASSQKYASQAYYLAESGVQEAIFKLKNDSSWKSAFESCLPWVIPPYQRTGGIFSNGTYQIIINKLGCGQAEIISQAFIDISANKKAQRIVKVKVFKAIGSGSGVENVAMFCAEGAGLSLKNSANVNIVGGNVFTGGVIDAQNSAKLSSDKSISARSQIDVENSASIIANASTTINAAGCSGNISPWPCNETPPESIVMPAIDFDSSIPNSYKNQADFVYTEQEFEDLLDGDDNLTGIIYITGNVEITGSDKLTVSGLLIVDGNITLKNSSQLTINNAGDGKPAGLLSKGKIETENSSTLMAEGLVYALNEIRFGNSGSINLNGGIMSGTAIIFENSVSVNITYNQQIVNIVLSSAPGDSPTISLDHWEEEY